MNITYITISEGIGYLKMLRERHSELLALRNQNAVKETRFYGANADKNKEINPVYDVKALDRLVTSVAKEVRVLDMAIKTANATFRLEYEWRDDVLGEIE
jgi:hypothetical protein